MRAFARSRRPPFAALVAFDAIVRHGSVTKASVQLALTQSAVSHRLRALERHFGVALLERLNPGLRLTPAGAQLVGAIAPILGALDRLDDVVLRSRGRERFRLGVGQALLAGWLSRRLPALAAAFPELAIEIQTYASLADVDRRNVDLALVWVPRRLAAPDAQARPFPDEAVFPVAAPGLVGGIRGARGGAWRRDLPLIDKRAGEDYSATPEWSWSAWLDAGDARPPAFLFRDVGGALQCAADGNGVALGRSLLVADALAARRLIRLVPPALARPCAKLQIARWTQGSHPLSRDVADWLVRAAAATLQAGDARVLSSAAALAPR